MSLLPVTGWANQPALSGEVQQKNQSSDFATQGVAQDGSR